MKWVLFQLWILIRISHLLTIWIEILGASEITANLYCNCVHLRWEGCVICSIYICGNLWNVLYPVLYITCRTVDISVCLLLSLSSSFISFSPVLSLSFSFYLRSFLLFWNLTKKALITFLIKHLSTGKYGRGVIVILWRLGTTLVLCISVGTSVCWSVTLSSLFFNSNKQGYIFFYYFRTFSLSLLLWCFWKHLSFFLRKNIYIY